MSAPASKNGSGQTAFGERYTVDTRAPLPDLSTIGGTAYMVKDQERPGRPLYALVQHPTVAPRRELFKQFKSSPIPNLICPLEQGLMMIQEDGAKRQRLVTIFDRPTGGVLMTEDGIVHDKVQPPVIRKSIVLNILKVLVALHKRGVRHRMILPTRLYFSSEDSDDISVGECYSAPPGYGVPDALDPLELALADSYARGEGAPHSDFYQFGAALMCLFERKSLWAGRDRSSFLMARVNQGSFWALGGGQDIPGALGGLIRGLMSDEPDERWTGEDVLDWFEHLTKTKRVGLKTWSLNRPTSFKGVSYVDRRLLADALAQDPLDASAFIRNLDFPSWAQSSVRDQMISEKLQATLGFDTQGTSSGLASSSGDAAKTLAKFCLFLHPTGPIRYKGLSVFVDAIPGLLAHVYSSDDRDKISALSELLDSKFLTQIGEIIGDEDPTFVTQANMLRRCIPFAHNKSLGKGMERVLYTLSPTLPCISQKFNETWVATPKQMLSALDRIAATGGAKNALLDRHIAGFLAAHGENLDRAFNQLAAAQSDPSKFGMLVADFFGNLQKSLKVPALPDLTNSLVDGLGPAVKSLKNRKRRDMVQGLLDRVKKGGDISKLTTEVNMVALAAEDARELSRARATLAKLDREKLRLSKKIAPTDPEALQKGYKAVRFVAMVIFGITLSMTIM